MGRGRVLTQRRRARAGPGQRPGMTVRKVLWEGGAGTCRARARVLHLGLRPRVPGGGAQFGPPCTKQPSSRAPNRHDWQADMASPARPGDHAHAQELSGAKSQLCPPMAPSPAASQPDGTGVPRRARPLLPQQQQRPVGQRGHVWLMAQRGCVRRAGSFHAGHPQLQKAVPGPARADWLNPLPGVGAARSRLQRPPPCLRPGVIAAAHLHSP